MKNELLIKAIRAFAPMALGAVGAYVALTFPAGFSAFCAGRF